MDEILKELKELRELMERNAPKELYTPAEFAALAGMTPRRVRELCNVDGFPHSRDERKIYVHKEAFAWIKSRADLPH